MSRPRTKGAARPIAAAVAAAAFGGLLAGCSNLFVPQQDDSYLARRETVAAGGGDAVAANTVTQMVDPWPAYSGDKTIAFNGEKMQHAVDRYRTGKVIEPADPENFMSNNQSGQTINQTTVNSGPPPGGSTPGQ